MCYPVSDHMQRIVLNMNYKGETGSYPAKDEENTIFFRPKYRVHPIDISSSRSYAIS